MSNMMAFLNQSASPGPQHITADPQLAKYHNPESGPRPAQFRTHGLPIRTLLLQQHDFNQMMWAQTHAFYEEIDVIDDADVKECAPLAHWHVVHPLSQKQITKLRMGTLLKLQEWIGRTQSLYVGDSLQVKGFKYARLKTLELVNGELEKRMKSEEVAEDDVSGIWREVDEHWTTFVREGEEDAEQGMPNEIDYLFEDLPSPLLLLPAEIRNEIYERVIFSDAVQVIRINERGFISPPSILAVCRQIRAETCGYMPSRLSSPTTIFEAQVREYDARPLNAALDRIAKQTGIPRSYLVARTKVKFVGRLNFGNLLAWIHNNINDPVNTPTFALESAKIPNYVGETVFEGHNSLKAHVAVYRLFLERGASAIGFWNWLARQFLADLEQYRMDVVPSVRWDASDAEHRIAVWQTFAIWHHRFLKGDGKKSEFAWGRKRKRDPITDHHGVAELMYAFGLRVEGERRRWR
ncbi:hypothetical protein N0V90_008916 [Kalmusia sp. IMI 367209]|nr:hypothetical protein N0V90_008916 [Kalmusia sp. IMI 367209]